MALTLACAAAPGCNDSSSSSVSDVFGVEHLEPGDRCEHGGIVVRSGQDTNDDGAPDGETSEHVVCNGAPGRDGQDADALVSVSELPPDDACEAGGTRISAGVDRDDDGELDEEEVTSSSLICTPTATSGAQTPLVELQDVEASDRCAAGGVVLLIGEDTNANGALDADEIEDSRIICHGEGGGGDAAARLIDAESTPPDGTCLRGGVTLRFGADDNGNDTLDDAEVDSTEAICRRYFVDVVPGGDRTCAILSDGDVVCWGASLGTRLERPPGGSTRPAPVTLMQSVPGLHGAVELALGFDHLCARMGDGTVRCLGDNTDGQLGDGTRTSSATPTTVMAPGNVRLEGVETLTAGDKHTCAGIADGFAYCWGDNALGQLGDGTQTTRDLATFVPGLSGVGTLAAGQAHTCALLNTGTVHCWGDNGAGQVGNGSMQRATSPAPVVGLVASSLAAGGYHTCVVDGVGNAVCWGSNSDGQVGTGLMQQSYAEPQYVYCLTCDNNRAVVGQITVGERDTCALPPAALDQPRRPVCWGSNNFGAHGTGDTSSTSTFVPAHSALLNAHFTRIRMRGYTTCGVTKDGEAWCWGENNLGQTGITPPVGQVLTPAPVRWEGSF